MAIGIQHTNAIKFMNCKLRIINYVHECSRNGGFKLQLLMGYRMIEAKYIGMQTQTTTWIIAIAILYVTTYRVSHISSMYTNLIFSSCLQAEFHKRITCRALQGMEMCDGIFSTIIHR